MPSNAYRNRIRDAVHGFIRLSDSEIRFIDFPEFQRLRRIRQLALTLFEGGGQTARCLVWEFEDVVIAHVVEDWYEQAGGYIDRTALQRFMYFLKASGVPLAINYRIHYYGPYSYEVTDRIELAYEGLNTALVRLVRAGC